MAPDPTTLLSKLLRSACIDDHEEALATSAAALKANGQDSSALNTRVVALLKLDRFDEALKSLRNASPDTRAQLFFYEAYALYKTGDLDAATKLLENTVTDSDQRGVQHLAAQVAYRAEKFAHADDLYRSLQSRPGGRAGEDNDLAINSLAVHAQCSLAGQHGASRDGEESRLPDGFEAAFNMACRHLANNRVLEGAVLLGKAAKLCQASPDLSEEDKEAEMLPILVQQLYASVRLGRTEKAAEIANCIDLDGADASTRILAHVNTIVLQQQLTPNPFLAHRLVASPPPMPTEGSDKLFGYQTAVLERNSHTVNLQSQKFGAVQRSVWRKLEDKSPLSTITPLSSLRAAAAAGTTTGKPALKKLAPLLEKRPKDLGLLLTVVQLHLNAQNPVAALTVLESLSNDELRFVPGIVALKVSLLQKLGRRSGIRTEMAKAARHWIARPDGVVEAGGLLKEAGTRLLHSADPHDLETARATFEMLTRESGSDIMAKAGLVASTATSDYAKVGPYMQGLESVDAAVEDVDVAALVDGGVVAIPALLEKQRQKRAAESEKERPSKKRKLRKLPKDYVEGKKMDPERWLPLRDRSSYKPRGKKGKKKGMEAQGGVVKEEVLELVGGAGNVKVEKAGGAGGKKKKGKK